MREVESYSDSMDDQLIFDSSAVDGTRCRGSLAVDHASTLVAISYLCLNRASLSISLRASQHEASASSSTSLSVKIWAITHKRNGDALSIPL